MGDYVSNEALHTFEHLFATYARNSEISDKVIYIGPMGCRTGFYLLMRDTATRQQAIDLARDSFKFISEYKGEIPGAARSECGNSEEHDLEAARAVAIDMVEVLKDWNEEKLDYDYEG
jgi:S-ribosylhomocysteine lyase